MSSHVNFLNEALYFAKAVSIKAAQVMRLHFSDSYSIAIKSDNSLVTLADKEINSLVIEQIKTKYPDHAVCGEEESYAVVNTQYTWVCDPIDGTFPFTLGIPTNVFSLTMVNNLGQPVIAVVHDPYLQNMFTAVKANKSACNETTLEVNKSKEVQESIIACSGRHSKFVNPETFTQQLNSESYRFISLNSVLYESMLVASGKIAATIYIGDATHDVASAKLIVEESGGKVTDLFGKEQKYNSPIKGAIISNGEVHEQLLEIVRNHAIA